ncbi:hypothetical protein MPTK1_7g17610 [Marchantia polymorpha subsp. ruderalis]|uniref:Uncharacterized protein n=2 Tax=Marchantia polymorpha TaxID=3197 RepID=A0AAF6C0U0_MARPO|nr:hypothetical protein MARPO_3786s0001 [Marchantia polymorpha]BBN17874.1 hypothetical protein Mp_7g17610 [Marchantia polymorpha subsp. ruderalis]|eukprot:PTQ26259.1 hypothetical protein MARPO_3786s0001 [Marchantia polymorpha]
MTSRAQGADSADEEEEEEEIIWLSERSAKCLASERLRPAQDGTEQGRAYYAHEGRIPDSCISSHRLEGTAASVSMLWGHRTFKGQRRTREERGFSRRFVSRPPWLAAHAHAHDHNATHVLPRPRRLSLPPSLTHLWRSSEPQRPRANRARFRMI